MGVVNTDRDAAWYAKLHKLWSQTDPELSAREIGKILKVTKNAVIGAARRSGCAPRQSPIIRSKERAVAHKTPKQRDETFKTIIVVSKPDKEPERMHTPPQKAVRTRTEPCAWIYHMGPPARFCEAVSAPGKSYCPEHCAIAYVKIENGRLMTVS
jgi:GcrA cell cycle regulator